MEKTLLSLGAMLTLFTGIAQTQLFFEDFEGGAGGFTLNTIHLGGTAGSSGDDFWTVNNSYSGGSGTIMFCTPFIGSSFSVGNTPAQPVGIRAMNGNYLHILSEETNGSGITNSNYGFSDNTICIFAASHFTSMTSDINTSSFTNVTLKFWWLNKADPGALGELYYSTDAGIRWTQKTGTTYEGSTLWAQESLNAIAWGGQASLRFGFRFDNAAATNAADPAFSIDDVLVTGDSGPCSNSNSSFSEVACFSYTVPSGDETYTTSGIVMDTIFNVAGCDSIMTINATVTTMDTLVSGNSFGELLTMHPTGTYQWIDCNDHGKVISGAINSSYAPASAGDYAVIITDNSCVDTSECIVFVANIGELTRNEIAVFPNPSNGEFMIDLSGQIILSKNGFIPKQIESFDLRVGPGVYTVSIRTVGTDVVRQARITVN